MVNIIKSSKLKAFICALLLFTILIPYNAAGQSDPFAELEKDYFKQKNLGNYGKAIRILTEWTSGLDDKISAEINLFRIYELAEYQELIKDAVEAYKKILKSNFKIKKDPYLKARIKSFLGLLNFRKGDEKKLSHYKTDLGFINDFRIIGPFNNRNISEFREANIPERKYNREGQYKGKLYMTRWFDLKSSLLGIFDAEEIYSDVSGSSFYLYSVLDIKESADYRFYLGKTGNTVIWINGEKIFINEKEHGFFYDQYCIKLYLTKGTHSLLIKIGDSGREGIKLSLRLTDDNNVSVKTELPKSDEIAKGKHIRKDFSFSQGLNSLYTDKTGGTDRMFRLGYLFYMHGLYSEYWDEIKSIFSSVGGGDRLSPHAFYYLGMIENDKEKKEHFFRLSAANSKQNLEAIYGLVQIKLENNFLHDAYALTELINSIKKLPPKNLYFKARIFMDMGWFDDALKIAAMLKDSEYPSLGYIIEGSISLKRENFSKAFDAYKYLCRNERGNWFYIERLISCLKKTGRYEEAVNELIALQSLYTNSFTARSMLCDFIKDLYGARASIPYLTSIIELSPLNPEALLKMGLAYHMMGEKGLAVYYLDLAALYDPKNFSLKRYLKIIRGRQNEAEDFKVTGDFTLLSAGAEKYKDEPALILLNEEIIRVYSDGSSQSSVHKIFLVNDKSAAKDFSQQYVIFNPSSDRIENLKCTVTNNGSSIEASKTYIRSLSDPESRLYYDLQAVIITVPSVKKGSIIDFKYTIQKQCTNEYKNYFGEKIIIGDEYRTMISNLVLSSPEDKKIYYHLKDINKNNFKEIKGRKSRIYHLLIKNSPPYKKETSMPYFSDFLPAIYFTSHKDWGALYKWYFSLIKDRINVSPEMQKDLRDLVQDTDSPLEKVMKIYNHVNSKIRYVGFELGVGGIQPRNSDLTYHTRMGDCKDTALVLVAMLREAGIDARIALLRTRDKGKANISIPYMGDFNHAICYVNLEGGFFIDGTSKFSGFRELPSDDRDVMTFVLDSNGYSFINTESPLYFDNIEKVETNVYINSKGDTALTRRLFKQGVLAAQTRFGFIDNKNNLSKISAYWNENYTGAKVSDLRIEDQSYNAPVSYSYKISIPSFLQAGLDESSIRAFLITTNYYKDYAMLKHRVHPIMFTMKWESHITIKYHIPDSLMITNLPKDEEFRHKKFYALFKYSKVSGENIVEVKSILKFRDYNITTADYKLFRKLTRFIYRKEEEKLVFNPKK